jgi:hypothetical protein
MMAKGPPKPQQIQQVQGAVSASTSIAAAIAAGVITQDRVNSIVAAVIDRLRAGE